jgi:hypothetical protein
MPCSLSDAYHRAAGTGEGQSRPCAAIPTILLTGFDPENLARYAKGVTTWYIQRMVKERYGVALLPILISEITADLELQAGHGAASS